MEPADNKPYIRETIEEKPRTPFWKKLAGTVFLAVVFGLIAACTFVFGKNVVSRFAASTEAESSEIIVFPPDNPPVQTEASTETAQPDTHEETAADPETEAAESTGPTEESEDMLAAVESVVAGLIAADQPDLSDVTLLYRAAADLVEQTNRSLVAISIARKGTDAFGMEYSYTEESFGVIVAVTSKEVLILTPYAESSQADGSVSVRFNSKEVAGAYTKSTDKTSGLSMLAVTMRSISSETKEAINVIELGNSFLCTAGQPVIAMGIPAGAVGSLNYGMLTYVQDEVAAVDNVNRMLHTDMRSLPGSCGFLISLSGKMVGWFDEDHAENGCITAVGISDLKSYLQNLSNGLSTAYLGITGQTLSTAMKEQLGIEESGVYVLSCLDDGPAMIAGLMSGDIITQISGEPVIGMATLRNMLLNMNTEQTVKITVLRRSNSSYQSLDFDIHLERR